MAAGRAFAATVLVAGIPQRPARRRPGRSELRDPVERQRRRVRLRNHLDSGWAFGAGFDMELWRDWRLSFGYRREQGRDGIASDGFNLRLSFEGWTPPPSLTLTTHETPRER